MDEFTRTEFQLDLALNSLIFLAERDELGNYSADEIVEEIKQIPAEDINLYLTLLSNRKLEDRLEYPDIECLKAMRDEVNDDI